MCQKLYEISKLFPPRDDNFLSTQDFPSAPETDGNLSAKNSLIGLIVTVTLGSLLTKLYATYIYFVRDLLTISVIYAEDINFLSVLFTVINF